MLQLQVCTLIAQFVVAVALDLSIALAAVSFSAEAVNCSAAALHLSVVTPSLSAIALQH